MIFLVCFTFIHLFFVLSLHIQRYCISKQTAKQKKNKKQKIKRIKRKVLFQIATILKTITKNFNSIEHLERSKIKTLFSSFFSLS